MARIIPFRGGGRFRHKPQKPRLAAAMKLRFRVAALRRRDL
jgi:hypothetical protein